MIGAVFLMIFKMLDGSNTLLLFVVLFISAGFSFGLLSLITGPIATEAAPLGLIASTGGVIVGIGEIFGGGVAPGIGGAIAGRFGIQHTLDLALGGLVVGTIVSLFYRETAPRKVGRSADESALDQLEDRVGGVRPV
jgi:MFS family permease